MNKIHIIILFVLTILLLGVFVCNAEVLFMDDFESGTISNWHANASALALWSIDNEGYNYVLRGRGETGLNTGLDTWYDYRFKAKIKIILGKCELAFRVSPNGRYYVGFVTQPGAIYLDKDKPWGTKFHLTGINLDLESNKWYTVEIVTKGNNIKLFIESEMFIDYTDKNDPLLNGGIQVISLGEVLFDDIKVESE